MKIGSELVVQTLYVGAMAVVFIYLLKYVGGRFNIPVISTVAKTV